MELELAVAELREELGEDEEYSSVCSAYEQAFSTYLESLRAPPSHAWHDAVSATMDAAEAARVVWVAARDARLAPLEAALDSVSATLRAREDDPRPPEVAREWRESEEERLHRRCHDAYMAWRAMSEVVAEPPGALRLRKLVEGCYTERWDAFEEWAGWGRWRDVARRKQCGCVCDAHCCLDAHDCIMCLGGRKRPRPFDSCNGY